jgi:hypothetical protein
MCDPVHALKEAAMEHQFFIRQQNLRLHRSLVAASEAAAAETFKATDKGSSERTAAQKELMRLLSA